jgi:hypothetical protein
MTKRDAGAAFVAVLPESVLHLVAESVRGFVEAAPVAVSERADDIVRAIPQWARQLPEDVLL